MPVPIQKCLIVYGTESMWHNRSVPRTFDVQHNFGCRNLVVSGSSFTYNNSVRDACTWPYYLRDLGGFDTVYDTSLPGAGNAHIANSLQWSLESDAIDPANSLVVVMWAFNNTDDFVVDVGAVKTYPFEYSYAPGVRSGIVGGAENYRTHRPANLSITPNIDQLKSNTSRAVENYLNIVSLRSYLNDRGYTSVFLAAGSSLALRNNDLIIEEHLDSRQAQRLAAHYLPVQDLFDYCLYYDYLESDMLHPSPTGHLNWCRERLVPGIVDNVK
jgi:hypothetical protein